MSGVTRSGWAISFALLTLVSTAVAQDWPQWRGPNRDARASSFNAPQTWPAELTQQWEVIVGGGVSTPAVVGERVFVFTRQEGNEVLRCLNAVTGDEIWKDSYPAGAIRGGDSGFAGPRSSPTVAGGKVAILGVHGILGCYDAISGKRLWQNDDFENDVPTFHVSSSPIVVDGLCIAQLGGRENGAIVAFDLVSGDKRWDWQGDEPAYGSPVLMNVDGTRLIVAPTSRNLVALTVDGKLMWEMPYEQGGRYTSATPIVRGDTLIVAGPGTGISAFRLKTEGDKIVEVKIWSNDDNSVQFNTPVLKGNLLVGLSTAGQLFCIDINNGESTAWTAPLARAPAEGSGEAVGRGVQNAPDKRVTARYVQATQQEDRQREDRGRRRGFDGQRGRGEGRDGFRGRGPGGRGGGGGHGSVIDAGSAFMALSPAGELVVFQPSGDAYSEVARYKVAEGTTNFRSEEGTYAYPVAVGEAIYIKDRESLTRWGVN